MLAVFPPSVLADMEEVEKRLQDQAISREPNLQSWTAEPLDAGGKRVRPLLLMTAFEAAGGGNQGPEAREHALGAAVSIELIHTASLVHDDLMDQAESRRGKPSTYHAHGVEGAILVGDYLFTQAFALGAKLPGRAMHVTADACRRLCEGQLREQAYQRSGSRDPDEYLRVIRDKTSALLAAACGIGAICAGASDEVVAKLQRYGEAIGNSFQILDDVLDIAGDPKWTGKPVGTDYLAGTMSGPFLHHVAQGGTLPEVRRKEDFPKVREELLENGSIARSQLDAAAHTQTALLQLEHLPEGEARESLGKLAQLLMERAQ